LPGSIATITRSTGTLFNSPVINDSLQRSEKEKTLPARAEESLLNTALSSYRSEGRVEQSTRS